MFDLRLQAETDETAGHIHTKTELPVCGAKLSLRPLFRYFRIG